MKEKLKDKFDLLAGVYTAFAIFAPGLWLYARYERLGNPLAGWMSIGCLFLSLYVVFVLRPFKRRN